MPDWLAPDQMDIDKIWYFYMRNREMLGEMYETWVPGSGSVTGGVPEAPDNLAHYGRLGPGTLAWQPVTEEAPIDGVAYARRDATWAPSTAFIEPPDAQLYGRRGIGSLTWDLTIPEAPIDGTSYARRDANWVQVAAEAPDNTQIWGRVGPNTGGAYPALTWQPTIPEAPDDVTGYVRFGPGAGANANSWQPTVAFIDAPDNAKLYGRAGPNTTGPWPQLSWNPVVEEAPIDGTAYARRDAIWEATTAFVEPIDDRIYGRRGPGLLRWDLTVPEAPDDLSGYVRFGPGATVNANTWQPTTAFVDAPDNAQLYGRAGPNTTGPWPQLSWNPVVPEAPDNITLWGRYGVNTGGTFTALSWAPTIPEAPNNTFLWARFGPDQAVGSLNPPLSWAEAVPEAPDDTKIYGRYGPEIAPAVPVVDKTRTWKPVVPEAPDNIQIWARVGDQLGGLYLPNTWVPVLPSPTFEWDGTWAIAGTETPGTPIALNIPATFMPTLPILWDAMTAGGFFFNNFQGTGTPSGIWEVHLEADWGAGLAFNYLGTVNLDTAFSVGGGGNTIARLGVNEPESYRFQRFDPVASPGGINFQMRLAAGSAVTGAAGLRIGLRGAILGGPGGVIKNV